MSELGFHHHAILVADLARAEAFYGGVLGLKVKKRWLDDEGDLRSVWYALGENAFVAIERAEPHPGIDIGHHCFALATTRDERSAWIRRFEDANIPLEKVSEFSIYVRDPEGNQIALSHWPVAAKHPKHSG